MSGQYTVVAITLAYMVCVGFVTLWVRRASNTARGFTEGGRQFPAVLIGFLVASEFIGTGVSVGTSQAGYNQGISAAWNVFALAIGFVLFGIFLAAKYKELGLNTISGVLASRYGEPTRIAASVMTVFALQIGAASIYASGGAVLAGVLGITTNVAIVTVGAVAVAYVSIGGMRSIVYTNIIHALIKYLGVVLAFGFGLTQAGGLTGLRDKLPSQMFVWDTVGWPQIGSWFVAGIGSIFATQHVIQAIHTVPDSRAAQRACFYCAGLMVPFGVLAAGVGMISAAMHPGINSLQAFPAIIVSMDRFSASIVVAGLAASLFGTIAALSISTATLLMKDFFDPLMNRGHDDRRSVIFIRCASLGAGLIPILMALGSSNILNVAYLSKSLRGTLAILVLLAFYAPRFGTASVAFWGVVVSLPATIIWYLMGNPWGVDNAYIAIITPLLIMGAAQIWTKENVSITAAVRITAPATANTIRNGRN